MCGRYTLSASPDLIAKRFSVTSVALSEFKPNYNIPPRTPVPVVVATDLHRRLETAVWALRRPWAPQIANLTVEKVFDGPLQNLLRAQRCLTVADGFYEWKEIKGISYPAYFCLPDRALFAFAAIYDEGEPKMFSIFTTPPHPLVGTVHKRSPVILTREGEEAWLDPRITYPADLEHILVRYTGPLEGWPVSTDVNKTDNNYPDLIKPVESPLDLTL